MGDERSRQGEDPIEGERVRRALEALADERDPLRVASALRAELPPELARRAAELHRLRRKAREKFPHEPPPFATTKGFEQASSEPVARARARRIAAAVGDEWVADLTCGIGGDSLALARAGVRLVVCDRDAAVLACARANLRAAGLPERCVLADAARPAVRAGHLLIDPDRRAQGRRSLDPRAWSPPLARALELALAARGACVKLPPSFRPEDAPPLAGAVRWQWVSWRRELAETALWTGALARAAEDGAQQADPLREATALDAEGRETSLEGRPSEAPSWPAGELARVRWLAEADVAVARAGLVGLLAERTGARALGPGLAWLGAEERPSSPMLRVWRALGSAPLDKRRVRELLARHDVGELEVLSGGRSEPPELLARRLRGRGRRRGTLVALRLERGHVAFLIEAVPGPP